MALRLTPTIAICGVAALGATIGLARPGDSSPATADSRYESAVDASGEQVATVDEYGGLGGAEVTTPPAEPSASEPASAGPASAGPASIAIEGFDFGGDTAVAPGSDIVVTNLDGAQHTLTSDDGLFDSGRLGEGATATIVAPAEPGTYPFFCVIHPSMRGSLVVE